MNDKGTAHFPFMYKTAMKELPIFHIYVDDKKIKELPIFYIYVEDCYTGTTYFHIYEKDCCLTMYHWSALI